MDLKSMLNDSAAQRPPPPRLHTSASSISERPYESQAQHEIDGSRPTPLTASGYGPDGRPSGSYFAVQSPSQHNSASTPSAGTQSAHSGYTQSPGPGGPLYTPRRDTVTPQHVPTPGYVPPSPIGVQPQTPGTQYYPGQPTPYAQTYTPQSAVGQRPPTRDEYPHTNGRPVQPQTHHMSPPPPHHLQTPSTPLGPPPANYPRPPVHSQRPPSQGYDHLRRASFGSVGSNHSREQSMAQVLHNDVARQGSAQRTHSSDEDRLRQERERSDESVSPKTIPRPPPHRTSSTFSSHAYERSPAVSHRSYASPSAPVMADQQMQPAIQSPMNQHTPPISDPRSHQPTSRPSPGARPPASITPQPAHSPLPAQPSPPSTKPPSKKRTASVISTAPPTSMPPQKKIKREEKPIWAQSMRKRRLTLGNQPRERRRRDDVEEVRDAPRGNTPGKQDRGVGSGAGPKAQGLSLLIDKPRNDLLYVVGEWVYGNLGTKIPPHGSVFEIEAKLGVIWDIENESRIRLPVRSEAVFDRSGWPGLKTKFDTSVMSSQTHEGLNKFLNHVIRWTTQEIAAGKPLDPMEYAHTVEWDEYYELTKAGRENLQQLAHWVNPKHAMKVRRTFSKQTGEMKAQIIKTRVADLEIYNPNDNFDYRLSISLETPWNGDESELQPDGGAGGGKHMLQQNNAAANNDRMKNRISYKHHDYQIDLTQIEHSNGMPADHEVEIEIMNHSILPALDMARRGEGQRYEELLDGFISNIRILASRAAGSGNGGGQQGTMMMQRPPGR